MENNNYNYGDMAESLFRQGYNCSQAVVAAFKDLFSDESDCMIAAASSLGGGVGRMREVCGAVTGMAMVAGILYGSSQPMNREDKSMHYRLIQDLSAEFKREFGSIVCHEILGRQGDDCSPESSPRTEAYYKKRPCAICVHKAAEIIGDYYKSHPCTDK